MRTFAQINSTLSALTGVPTTNSSGQCRPTWRVQQQLPADPDARELLVGEPGRHRAVGDSVLQRDGQHPALHANVAARRDLRAPRSSRRRRGIDQVTSALAARVLGSGLHSSAGGRPDGDDANSTTLIGKLCTVDGLQHRSPGCRR